MNDPLNVYKTYFKKADQSLKDYKYNKENRHEELWNVVKGENYQDNLIGFSFEIENAHRIIWCKKSVKYST